MPHTRSRSPWRPGSATWRIGAKRRGGPALVSFRRARPTARQAGALRHPFPGAVANRMDGDAYWANGRRYQLNPELGNLRRDANQKPIHGLLNFSPDWRLVSSGSDAAGAWTSSQLEFATHPALMAQFPFAHTIHMTHRLADGELQVETCLETIRPNRCRWPSVYHPYFRLPGAPRDQWRVHLAARDHLLLNNQLIPTGERRATAGDFSDPHPLSAGRSTMSSAASRAIRMAWRVFGWKRPDGGSPLPTGRCIRWR